MTWVRLDDGFPEHPKVIGLTDTAFRLAVTALCYSHRSLTDGYVPAAYPSGRLARAVPSLVTARLWVPAPDGDGWLIHDYLTWQTSRANIETIRKQRSDAGKKGAAARWQTDDSEP